MAQRRTVKRKKIEMPESFRPMDRHMKQGENRVIVESSRALNAFIEYCKLSTIPGEARSLSKLAAKTGIPERSLKRWCTDWDWKQRALEYDNEASEAIAEGLKDKKMQVMRNQAVVADQIMNKMMKALGEIDTERMSARDIAVLMELSVKMQLRVYGEPTEIIAQEISGRGGGPAQFTIVDLITQASGVVERIREKHRERGEEADDGGGNEHSEGGDHP